MHPSTVLQWVRVIRTEWCRMECRWLVYQTIGNSIFSHRYSIVHNHVGHKIQWTTIDLKQVWFHCDSCIGNVMFRRLVQGAMQFSNYPPTVSMVPNMNPRMNIASNSRPPVVNPGYTPVARNVPERVSFFCFWWWWCVKACSLMFITHSECQHCYISDHRRRSRTIDSSYTVECFSSATETDAGWATVSIGSATTTWRKCWKNHWHAAWTG